MSDSEPLLRASIACAAAGLVALGTMGVAAPPTTSTPTGPEQVIVYWGVSAEGEYFQTEPLDATVPSNVDVADPAQTLPLNEDASPTVELPSKKVLTGRAAEDYLEGAAPDDSSRTAKAVGFICTQFVSSISKASNSNYLRGAADQTCSGAYRSHWLGVSIVREVGLRKVPYSPERPTIRTASSSKTWDLLGDCGTDGSRRSAKLFWNVRGVAISSETGTTVRGGNVFSGQGLSTNCGWGIGG